MDVDIDFLDRTIALNLIKHVPASIRNGDSVKKHNTGVYCHSIPVDPLSGTASIDYKIAESRGYFKIDFLNVSIYQGIRDEAHLIQLLNTEPEWELLEQDEFTNMLFHINGYGNILRQMKPRSIKQLAAVLAMIRPAKRHLIGKSWDEVNSNVWDKDDTAGYAFKKSHATAYAMAIVVQMNTICEKLYSEVV